MLKGDWVPKLLSALCRTFLWSCLLLSFADCEKERWSGELWRVLELWTHLLDYIMHFSMSLMKKFCKIRSPSLCLLYFMIVTRKDILIFRTFWFLKRFKLKYLHLFIYMYVEHMWSETTYRSWFFTSWGFWGLNSDCQSWQQTPLPNKPSPLPCKTILEIKRKIRILGQNLGYSFLVEVFNDFHSKVCAFH